MTSWQIFAQPVFDLVESHIKAWRIRREQRRQLSRRQVCPQAAAAAADARSAGRGPASKPAPPPEVAAEEGGASSDDSLESPENSLPSRCRLCGKAFVYNSAPVPDLLPRQGWAHQDSFMRRAHEVEIVEVSVDAGHAAPAAAKPTCGSASPLSMVCTALDCTHTSMYCQCPGLANEHVPLNETGYLLPLPQRLVVRTCYVLAITTLAVVAPFVMSVIGLVGSVGWFPLTIAFPILCWIKVHRPRGLRLAAMRAVGVVMLFVAAGATVGAVYTMIHSFQTVEFFQ